MVEIFRLAIVAGANVGFAIRDCDRCDGTDFAIGDLRMDANVGFAIRDCDRCDGTDFAIGDLRMVQMWDLQFVIVTGVVVEIFRFGNCGWINVGICNS